MQKIFQNETNAVLRRAPVALVDDTDGKTPKTGITLVSGDMKICKNGGAESNHAGTLYESAGGDYYYEFATGEVDTLGVLRGRIVKSGCRTFRIAVQVVSFNPYGTPITNGNVMLASVYDPAKNAGLQRTTGAVVSNAGNTATVFATNLTGSNDYWRDCNLTFTSGALNGQTKRITAFTSTNGVVTVLSPFTATPAVGVTFVLVNI